MRWQRGEKMLLVACFFLSYSLQLTVMYATVVFLVLPEREECHAQRERERVKQVQQAQNKKKKQYM